MQGRPSIETTVCEDYEMPAHWCPRTLLHELDLHTHKALSWHRQYSALRGRGLEDLLPSRIRMKCLQEVSLN